jgi:hypothetical protein
MRHLDVFEFATCRRAEHDPDLWHAEEGSDDEQRAIALCWDCPVRDFCLDIGTDPNESEFTRHGVWGGVTARRRRRMRTYRDRYGIVTLTATDARARVAGSLS